MTNIVELIKANKVGSTTNSEEFCRCCFVKNEKFLDMRHDKFIYDGQEILLYEGFLKCSGLNPQVVLKTVKESSAKICKVCAALLENAYFFRGMCQNTDNIVQKRTKDSEDEKVPSRNEPAVPEPIKIEIDDSIAEPAPTLPEIIDTTVPKKTIRVPVNKKVDKVQPSAKVDSITITKIIPKAAPEPVEPAKKVIVLGNMVLAKPSVLSPLAEKSQIKRPRVGSANTSEYIVNADGRKMASAEHVWQSKKKSMPKKT